MSESARDPAVAAREALLTDSTPYVSYALLTVNVAVYGLDFYRWDFLKGQSLYSLLSLDPFDVLRPGWGWLRLLTCCFVHGEYPHGGGMDLAHIGMNMFSLYAVGPLLERLWGRWRFLVLYLIAGVGGSSVALARQPIHLVGASGALWGLLGGLAVWLLLNRRHLPKRLVSSWWSNLLFALLLNVAISLLPGISAAAHFGGGTVGAVAAALLHFQRFGSLPTKLAAVAGLTLLPLVCAASLAVVIHRSALWAAARPMLEAERQRSAEERERIEFNEKLEQIGVLEKPARQTYEKEAEPLVEKGAGRRDKGKVSEVVAALEQGDAELQKAIAVLRQAGPYQSQRVEEARQKRLELLEVRRELYGLAARYLKEGKDWKDPEETELRRLIRREGQLQKEWKALLSAD